MCMCFLLMVATYESAVLVTLASSMWPHSFNNSIEEVAWHRLLVINSWWSSSLLGVLSNRLEPLEFIRPDLYLDTGTNAGTLALTYEAVLHSVQNGRIESE